MSGSAKHAGEWDTYSTEQGVQYFYCRRTGETTWERPDASDAETEATLESTDGVGTAAASAGESTRDEHAIGEWEAIWAEEHQRYYYCNRTTGESQWENPAQGGVREPPPPYSSQAETQQGDSKDDYYDNSGVAVDSPTPCSRYEGSPHAAILRQRNDGHGRRVSTPQQRQQATPIAAEGPAIARRNSASVCAATAEAARAPAPARTERAGLARPSSEKEVCVLRDAINRRQESVRRLEEVRAGARARLAALKAETEARRAAKSALAAKGIANVKVPAAPSTAAPRAEEEVASATEFAKIPTATLSSEGSTSDGGASLADESSSAWASSSVASSPPFSPLAPGLSPRRSPFATPLLVDRPTPAEAAAAAGGAEGETLASELRRSDEERSSGDVQSVDRQEEVGGLTGTVDVEGHHSTTGGLTRPINKSRQAPTREANAGVGTVAASGMIPGGNEEGKDKPGAAAAAAAAVLAERDLMGPGSSAKLKDEQGFRDLWAESVKVRQTQQRAEGAAVKEAPAPLEEAVGGGDSDADRREERPSSREEQEVQERWHELDLCGEEAGGEIAAIMALAAPVEQQQDPKGVAPLTSIEEGQGRGGHAGSGEAGRQHGSSLTADEGVDSCTTSTVAPNGVKHVVVGGGSSGGKQPSVLSMGVLAEALGLAIELAQGAEEGAETTPPGSSPEENNAASTRTSPARAGEQSISAGQAAQPSHEVLANASERVSRLRGLLDSEGGVEAWARLLSADGHLSCRRLADFALAGYSAGAAATVTAPRLRERCRRLCHDSLGCLAICGRVSQGMWGDLSRLGPDGNGRNRPLGPSHGGDTRLTRLLSLCVDLAGSREVAAARTGLNEHEYFFGKGVGGGGREGREEEEQEEEGEERQPDLSVMGLALVYEILTGACRDRVDSLRCWDGMSVLIGSLLDLIAAEDQEEDSYMGATRCLLAANHPFLRRSSKPSAAAEGSAAAATASASDSDTAVAAAGLGPRPSEVIPALLGHLARHEVQGAVLHIFNEEGYPNGDVGLARLCSVFCSDAFEEGRHEDLFYVNDVKVLLDVVIRELYNLPAGDDLRGDYLHLLERLLDQSEWSTRGGRYREGDIQRAAGIST